MHSQQRPQPDGRDFPQSLCPEQFEAHSAGIEPSKLNPVVVEVMREIGIDISGRPTKAVIDFVKGSQPFHHVITVCDKKAAERCPIFSGVTNRLD